MKSISKLFAVGVWLSTAVFAAQLQASKIITHSTVATDSTYSTIGLFDAQTRPVQVSKQFEFTEGPAVDKKGNVFFTDQPNDAIWEYDTQGKLSKFAGPSGRSNGMYFDRKGNLISCADDNNELISFSPDKKRTVLLKNFEGHRLNGPNDLWVDAHGGIYFTDPLYVRDYWNGRKPDISGEKVYYLPSGKTEAQVLPIQVQKPNGIVGTADGKYLFVADIGANKTYKFDIAADGKLTNQRLFTQQGSDGMTLDSQGNVYLTGSKGVYIYNPQGIQIGLIAIAEPWTANVAFGGKHKDVLFITASKAVYTMQMKVHGIE
ncbi:SMP-30/gluconolactonase/LRE family protein [Mucilaginibacter robiniae]|uniref:SMP-30/gluconolactonase/LRE family protein n=1 Tax=Mucilaginibacter robiniae TaxID=2728022 RepID=A0A7L5E877_9SPHI|nr:SMP-30/gluconolactonase/LRE family protein [Mucilaginibacter robiniae]QJD98054.1 SMP-30/gluconolactonase/LRE family protein [Mucilaginibacter robiniae]